MRLLTITYNPKTGEKTTKEKEVETEESPNTNFARMILQQIENETERSV